MVIHLSVQLTPTALCCFYLILWQDNLKFSIYLLKDREKEGNLRYYKPKFRYIFCDMDGKFKNQACRIHFHPDGLLILMALISLHFASQGTLLNSKSQISLTTAKALKEALSRGVKVVVATGKVRTENT